MVDPHDLAREFERAFGRSPRLYCAPGRVNLIGEHTDYNDGFVMPMAIDRSTWVAAAPREGRTIVVRSREYQETRVLDVGPPSSQSAQSHQVSADSAGSAVNRDDWTEYVRGVATILDSAGAEMLIASDVPIGAGLGSSAALEVACGYALLDLAAQPIDLIELRDVTPEHAAARVQEAGEVHYAVRAKNGAVR